MEMLMSALDTLNAEFHVLVGKAEALGHTGLDELHALWNELTGQAGKDAAALTIEVKADAAQVAHDASAAMGPVLAEAEQDATKVAATISADAADFTNKLAQAQDAVQPPASA
jgi:hypothetical protein